MNNQINKVPYSSGDKPELPKNKKEKLSFITKTSMLLLISCMTIQQPNKTMQKLTVKIKGSNHEKRNSKYFK
ncbi:hypothetical protein BBN41_004592 [Salmonella enterica subsp. enterica serovar Mbandaka]|uniref:hypothetical protein n=1 Tax=Citrobacter sp. Cf115 TaxID=2985066 RepID=UPI0025817D0C|nr:hypothetical protein [Citrobacter sp. Cf115]EDQ6672771.1 hypothetical protein [Salmonella enterica subsp. enterica serovar Mbandaka]EDX6146756.1 hypothetical protein [Salmonella enterica subsp. enterica serovar 4,[5],12:i:-]EHM6072842.1 hypothetical protein [Salmonella enterica]MDM3344367.1 hypothetical protein [Citrobacter sp. Cf115]